MVVDDFPDGVDGMERITGGPWKGRQGTSEMEALATCIMRLHCELLCPGHFSISIPIDASTVMAQMKYQFIPPRRPEIMRPAKQKRD